MHLIKGLTKVGSLTIKLKVIPSQGSNGTEIG
jgi:hypothetical protein